MEAKTFDNGLTLEPRDGMWIVASHKRGGVSFEATITFRADRQWHVESSSLRMNLVSFPSLELAVDQVKKYHQSWLGSRKGLFDRQSEFEAAWQRISEG